jgi:hypothetical protein
MTRAIGGRHGNAVSGPASPRSGEAYVDLRSISAIRASRSPRGCLSSRFGATRTIGTFPEHLAAHLWKNLQRDCKSDSLQTLIV